MSKILIDVDGVVADTHAALLEAVGSNKKAEDIKEWDLFSTLEGKEKEKAKDVMNDPEFWGQIPLIDGAKKAVRLLKAYGHDVVWVTSPWKSCPDWDRVRRFYIKEHFGNDTVIITQDKYHVEGNVFIDDKVENVEAYKKSHPNAKVFIFDQPYNRDYHGVPRFSWNKVEKLL